MEKKYPNQVVVIGIHSPKFDNERESASIRKAMARYERNHPVLNDANRKLWDAYRIEGWPTIVVIDPEGRIAGRLNDERPFTILDQAVARLIPNARRNRTLSETPRQFTSGKGADPADGPLYFPGKVLADDVGYRLFVADSTHHRVIVTDLEGKMTAIAGNGRPGRADGSFDKASFHDPQGMAVNGQTLYVADRGNHLIRALDLKAKTVKTIAGTGYQSTERRFGGPALKTGLNSPWDLLFHNNVLYVAMAGDHQIWTLDLARHQLTPFAGNGMENIMDGQPGNSCFAQPSGLTTDGTNLYVADSEVSAIRTLPLDGKGFVKTLIGSGLFVFGDLDGPAPRALLQHALGVQFVDGKLYIADTYNSKIKVLDLANGACTTLVGGKRNGEETFNEPGGISAAFGKLYVADTNAHRIRVVDLKSKAVSTLDLQGVKAPAPADEPRKTSRGR